MKASLTKAFHFSASHTSGTRVFGKNYILEIALAALPHAEESAFEKKVQEHLIAHLESRDLGLHVDFLRGLEITDRNLLEVFWRRIAEASPGVQLQSMTLQRDAVTKTTLAP